MLRSSLFTAVAFAAVALVPSTASAQLTLTGLSCNNAGAVATMGATSCNGAWSGNDKNQQAGVLAALSAFAPISWTNVGASDDTNFGPFTSGPSGTTGTLTFDMLITGPFALAIKAGDAFSLYYFLNAGPGVTSVNFTTVGTSLNAAGAPNGLSHASLYRGPASVVPEPSTYALMGTGLIGLAAAARRRKTNA
jgi:hypothetical protein